MRVTARRIAALALLLAAPWAAQAANTPDEDDFEMTAANLLVVLRESPGANKQDDSLHPFGKIRAQLPDGRDHEFEASWYQYLGDLHLRLVFDGGPRVRSAQPDDLHRLALSPQEALAQAITNLRRRYGPPVALPWTGGLMQVGGDAPDLNSSYFLDREFWLSQAPHYPEGIVVAVPRRGGLVFARAGDDAALINLQFSAAALYAANERTRLSSALYLFKDGRWSVYQPPQKLPD